MSNLIKKYDYQLPKNLIAQSPASPRDSAKLLIYNRQTKKISFDRFYNLTKYLPPKSVLVFNDTRVIPARLYLKKPLFRQDHGWQGGGHVEILYLGTRKSLIEVLANRKLMIDSKLVLNKKIYFHVIGQSADHYFLKPNFSVSKVLAVLTKYGATPLPPYIKPLDPFDKKIQAEYQTIFAKRYGSIAAPTASLHFTKKLIKKIKAAGHDIKFITLHVGLGTFAPISKTNLKTSKLHEEYYEIGPEIARFINKAREDKRLIVAVGTTTTRALESSANKNGRLFKLRGQSSLFIKPPYKFKVIDGLITNFHVPKSSLMMLAAALIGRKTLLDIYQKAINKKLRFFSFGDGMLMN